jgi:hypothetical protein
VRYSWACHQPSPCIARTTPNTLRGTGGLWVNVACGPHVRPGFANLDLFPWSPTGCGRRASDGSSARSTRGPSTPSSGRTARSAHCLYVEEVR